MRERENESERYINRYKKQSDDRGVERQQYRDNREDERQSE